MLSIILKFLMTYFHHIFISRFFIILSKNISLILRYHFFYCFQINRNVTNEVKVTVKFITSLLMRQLVYPMIAPINLFNTNLYNLNIINIHNNIKAV